MRDNPKPFEIYEHFKGNRYQILTIAKDSEDGHLVVVYQAMYGDYPVYVRDLDMFMSPVDKGKYPDVSATYRFTKISSETELKDEVVTKVPKEASADTPSVAKTDEYTLDPAVERFLDADSIQEKLNILAEVRNRITDDMLQIMAVASDFELNEGSTEDKYRELKNCLLTKEKFESTRRG